MRLLLRVVLVSVLVAVVVSGCSRFDAALGQRQMMVAFKAGTPNSVKLRIRTACGSLPNVKTTPLPDLKRYPYGLNQLTYQVSNASSSDIARLQVCLSRFPSVTGATLQDSTDGS